MNFWDNFNKQNLIAAHRGYRAIRAENTIIAFKGALNKADLIELDVSFSKDGVPVVIHDDTLTRTTNAIQLNNFKSPYRVEDYTFKELLLLDFSSWFVENDPFLSIKKGLTSKEELALIEPQKVLSLKDALKFLKQNNMPVNIELKDISASKFDSIATKELVNIVKELNMQELVIFSSFNHKYLQELKILAPNIARAALQENFHPKDIINYLNNLSVDAYHFDVDIFDIDIIKLLRENSYKIGVYTVNNVTQKKILFDLGVNIIFTDYLD